MTTSQEVGIRGQDGRAFRSPSSKQSMEGLVAIPSSDVEIMLSGELLTTDDQLRLAAVLDALPMPQRVDPGLNGAWRKHVAQCGVVWWQKEASAGDRRAPHAHAPSAVRPDGGGR